MNLEERVTVVAVPMLPGPTLVFPIIDPRAKSKFAFIDLDSSFLTLGVLADCTFGTRLF